MRGAHEEQLGHRHRTPGQLVPPRKSSLRLPTAGGQVTYAVYKDPACTVLAAQAGAAPVTNGLAGPSAPQSKLAAGTYYWQASYSGDVSNQAAKSVCGSEKLIIAHKASLGLPS